MKTELRPDEVLIKGGKANSQRSIIQDGGHLYFTNLRLIFEPHKFNLPTSKIDLNISDIASVQKGWTKLFGVIPLVPNAIIVKTKSDEEYRFTVFGRGKWVQTMQEHLSN